MPMSEDALPKAMNERIYLLDSAHKCGEPLKASLSFPSILSG